MYFYIAQGVSASLLFPILELLPPIAWCLKLPLAFGINLALCVLCVWILRALFLALERAGRLVKEGYARLSKQYL